MKGFRIVRKALATFGWGRSVPFLDLSLPTFRDYADRHGYDLILYSQRCDRPLAWCKIPLLQELLAHYDFVLWIDADAIILDASTDLATVIPDDAYQAVVVVEGDEQFGELPNTGVWAMRAVPRAKELLDAIWAQEDLIDAPWWENRAFIRLVGWTLDAPHRKLASEWDAGTHILPEEWNALPAWPIGYRPARIRHYAGMLPPQQLIDMKTDRAMLDGRWPRYWLGRLERRLRRHPTIYTRAHRLYGKLRVAQRHTTRVFSIVPHPRP